MSAILAKAMNSTIGTDNFKSFDEILLSHKILVADSEAILCPLNFSVQNMRPNVNETTVLAFNLPASGSVNLIYSLGLSNQAGSASNNKYHVCMNVYKNGIQIGSADTYDKFSSEAKSSFEITANVDDVISITLSSTHTDSYYSLYLSLYSLNGKVVECAPVNIISKYGG